MVMPGRSYSSPSYRYGFGGQEKDDELKGSANSLAWNERMYDPRLARWSKVDGAVSYYPALGAYTYCANSPLYIRELDGNVIGTAIGGLIGGGISLGKALYDGKSGKDLVKAWVRGSTAGMVAGAVADITIATCGTGTVALTAIVATVGTRAAPYVVAAAAGGLSSAAGNATTQVIQHNDWGKKYSLGETAFAGAVGVVAGPVLHKIGTKIASIFFPVARDVQISGNVFMSDIPVSTSGGKTGPGLTGVFDNVTGEIKLLPSNNNGLPFLSTDGRTLIEAANRNGGHRQVLNLFENTEKAGKAGFSIAKVGANKLLLNFKSGVVNEQYSPDCVASPQMQQAITKEVRKMFPDFKITTN